MDQGRFAPGDPKMVAFAMMGAVNWITKWYDPAGAMTSQEIGRAFADYLVGGLTREPGAPVTAPVPAPSNAR